MKASHGVKGRRARLMEQYRHIQSRIIRLMLGLDGGALSSKALKLATDRLANERDLIEMQIHEPPLVTINDPVFWSPIGIIVLHDEAAKLDPPTSYVQRPNGFTHRTIAMLFALDANGKIDYHKSQVRGVAYCSKSDQFDPEYGAMLALWRATRTYASIAFRARLVERYLLAWYGDSDVYALSRRREQLREIIEKF